MLKEITFDGNKSRIRIFIYAFNLDCVICSARICTRDGYLFYVQDDQLQKLIMVNLKYYYNLQQHYLN
eukprot:UN07917